ncbi:MAG TPA: hypothetical protein ENK10_06965 [Acidobacteria bacterium]|nr:hypothetical protein [Acidobacteriota bacterium]
MPATGFICPKCGKRLTFDEAPEHLGSTGCQVMMSAAVQALINSTGDTRRGPEAGASASGASPTTTCRLQVMLERFKDYDLDPRVLDEAEEGTNIHAIMLKRGVGNPDWIFEEVLPGPEDEGKPGVVRHESGFLEYELWPGVFFSCVVDAHTRDWSQIEDLKTTRSSSRIYPPDVSAKVQVSLAALMAERLRGAHVERLGIWKFFRGAYDREKRWRYFEVERWDEAALRQHSEEFMRSLCEMATGCRLAAAAGESELDAYLRGLPADGKVRQMFVSRKWPTGKCGNWCSVRELCPAWKREVRL